MTERILQLNNELLGNNSQKNVFYTLAFSIILIFIIYSYLVGSIIFSFVENEKVEIKTRDLRSQVGVLEVEYLDLSRKITLEFARQLGFEEATNQVFISRKGRDKTLSLRANEI